jgi:UDP-N-acetylmuramoylalanine--D-glutamate ligase
MTQTEQKTQQNIIETFKQRTIHIYGITGAEGYAVLDWLCSLGHTKIVAHDFSVSMDVLKTEWLRVHEVRTPEDEVRFDEILKLEHITWMLGDKYAALPQQGDIFFVVQSWFRYSVNAFLKPFFATNLEVLPEYRDHVWTLTRLYFTLFPGKLIAVTGSDGKTSTTRMIGTIMQEYANQKGVRCIETGNDRTHVQSVADVASCGPKDFLVLEISDRQLSFKFPLIPDVAVVTNVTSNKHMDDYGGFENYVQTKGNLLRFQTKAGVAILNADDPASREKLLAIGAAPREWISTRQRPEEGMWVSDGAFVRTHISAEEQVMKVDELSVLGHHNWYNAMQALLAAEAAGVPREIAVAALKKFKGVQHRLQPIRRWRRVTFVEDSSGGNPANIPVSIQTFSDRPLVMIVGGYRQNLTVDEVLPIIRSLDGHNTVKALILFGQVAPKLAELLKANLDTFQAIEVVPDLAAAVSWAADHAAEFAHAQEAVVCMTPGFESFDQYKDYRARAEHFITLVNQLND